MQAIIHNAALSIGDFSKLTGCPIETIRYYEREGILAKAKRSPGGHRLYDQTNVQQLRFILKARQMGFSLNEVKELLKQSVNVETSCQAVLNLADRNLRAIQVKIEQLAMLKNELQDLSQTCRNCCAGKASSAECNIIEAMLTVDDKAEV